MVNDANCAANTLPANDDGSTGQITLPFRLNFYGTSYTSLWVNNNGNVTFQGPLGIYTPFLLNQTTPPIIAPFFADVDTRGSGSGLVTYGNTTYQGRSAFCVDWPNVGYYGAHTDKLNTFQLLLVDRSNTGAGNFDIIFNYNQIRWETGDASGGSGGFGGTSAAVGFSAGDGNATHFFSLPGSLQNGAFLDSNPSGLIHSDRGATVPGRYVFSVGNGAPTTSTRYVALGDSVPYGMGLVSASANNGPSRNAYPQYVDQGLPGLRALTYRPTGCGLTGDQLGINGAPSIDNPWTGANGDCGLSLHEAVFTNEIAAANLRSSPPALVTIQAGADDVHFSGCLKNLLGVPGGTFGSESCITHDAQGYHVTSKVSSELGSLWNGLTDTINFIHRNAPAAQIVVINYYQLLPAANAALTGTSTVCHDLRFSSQGGSWRQSIRAQADYFQQRLNGTIQSAASQFPDVALVNISGLMSGHEMCTLGSWLFDGLSNGSAGHPNATGQWELGQAVIQACDRLATRCIGR